MCRVNDFQIADVINPSKQVHCQPCVSWGGYLDIEVLFLIWHKWASAPLILKVVFRQDGSSEWFPP